MPKQIQTWCLFVFWCFLCQIHLQLTLYALLFKFCNDVLFKINGPSLHHVSKLTVSLELGPHLEAALKSLADSALTREIFGRNVHMISRCEAGVGVSVWWVENAWCLGNFAHGDFFLGGNFKEVYRYDMMVSLSFGFLFVVFLVVDLEITLLGSIEDDKLYVGMGQSYSIMFCYFLRCIQCNYYSNDVLQGCLVPVWRWCQAFWQQCVAVQAVGWFGSQLYPTNDEKMWPKNKNTPKTNMTMQNHP